MAIPTSSRQTRRTMYHTGRARGRRRRTLRVVTTASILVLAFMAFVAFEALQAARVSAMSPAPGGYIAQRLVTVRFTVNNLASLKNVVVRLDGNDVTATSHTVGERLSFTSGPLADGAHNATVTAKSTNIFARHVVQNLRFTVDTSIPRLNLSSLAAAPVITSVPAVFRGTTEAGARVIVNDGKLVASTLAGPTGAYTLAIKLPEGPAPVTFTATDRAGNQAQQRLDLLIDSMPPSLTVEALAKTVRQTSLTVAVAASDAAATPTLTASLNGHRLPVPASATGTLTVHDLPQGITTLLVAATDRGGHVVTSRQTFLVDSTERFGDETMIAGARGHDVVQLQTRLSIAGVFAGQPTGVYDPATVAAVKRLQTRLGMPDNGVVGEHVLAILSGRIVVSLSQRHLYLYRGDRLIKTYSVAVGQPRYPTPPGTFAIVSMQKNPTWLPPNSDWAKKATPIPPGATNPLGTRWMGTSAPGIGIHGVPAGEDATIGTYASHGCIRMHDWDAVDLFDRIVIGTPVTIQP
ncbi:MAG: L,D-transpeptidase family protein [Thermoleophilia bacterium]